MRRNGETPQVPTHGSSNIGSSRIRTADYKAIDAFKSNTTKRILYRVSHGGKQALEKKIEKREQDYAQSAHVEHDTMMAVDTLQASVNELTNEVRSDISAARIAHRVIESRA